MFRDNQQNNGINEVRALKAMADAGQITSKNLAQTIERLSSGRSEVALVLQDYAGKLRFSKPLQTDEVVGTKTKGSFAKRVEARIGLSDLLVESDVDEYSNTLKIPESFKKVLSQAVVAEDEIEFQFLLRRDGGKYKPEALIITGCGSPGAVESDRTSLSLVGNYLDSEGNEDVFFVLGHTHSKGTYGLGSQYADGFSGRDDGRMTTLDRKTMKEQRDEKYGRCLGFMLATYKPRASQESTRDHTTSVFFESYTRPGQTQKVQEF